jgi:hypothetical protein
MERRTLAIAIGAAVAAAIVIGVIVFASTRPPSSTASPTASPTTPTPSASASASRSPTPSPTPVATAGATICDSIATDEFRTLAAEQGWTSRDTVGDDLGARPFENFPGATPEGAIVCRWGEDPSAPSDNVTDLAWTALDPLLTEDAQIGLIDLGYERTEGPDGALFENPEGGDAYLFTGPDVRWAMSVDQLAYVKAPGE